MQVALTLTQGQHETLRAHLFPGDGLEAVALLLCGRRRGASRHRLLVRKIVPIPHESCRRTGDRVTWPTEMLEPLLNEATAKGLALAKVHGHDKVRHFSSWDDKADADLFPSVHSWTGDEPHASMIMLPDGELIGRAWFADGSCQPIDLVTMVGEDLRFWRTEPAKESVPEHARRIAQSFGAGTFALLRGLKVGVVGASGTGSPVIEQLARNCVGELVIVDPDRIEEKNLNRILNSTAEDARQATTKVEVARRTVAALGFGTKVETHSTTSFEPEVVRALADCDILFGCMDSVDGRHLLNRLAAFYLIPYFDLGVKIEADGVGGVEQVCGTVHYLRPDGSSLLSRGVYQMDQVRAAGLARTDPHQYRNLIDAGYLRGVAEDRPAVIQLNMLVASLAINELLARLHPFRLEANGDYAVHRISLSHGIFAHEPDGDPCPAVARYAGRGDTVPLLDWPELSEKVRG